MPGMYTPPDYDLAGFITGCVEEDAILGSVARQAGRRAHWTGELRTSHQRIFTRAENRERENEARLGRSISRNGCDCRLTRFSRSIDPI